MNAVRLEEPRMIAEDRIARIESDVAEIKDDVKAVNVRLNESIAANAREFGALRADTEKSIAAVRTEIGAVRTELEKSLGAVRTEVATHRAEIEKGFGAFRAELEKGFGALRVEIEQTRTAIVSTKLWMLITGIGTILAILGNIAAFITLFMRIAKII